jgi:hypothetical protein
MEGLMDAMRVSGRDYRFLPEQECGEYAEDAGHAAFRQMSGLRDEDF